MQQKQPNVMTHQTIAIACMLLAALCWGTAFFFVKVALNAYDPITITFVRCAVGAVVVGAAALLQSRHSSTTRRRRAAHGPRGSSAALLIPVAGVFTALALLGVALGQQYVSSSITGIVLGTVPVWTAAIIAIGLRIRGRASTWSATLTVALALGLLASVLPMVGAHAVATTGGVAILLAASFAHASSMVAVPAGIIRLGPILSTSLVMAVASLTLFPVWLYAHDAPLTSSLGATLALVELGILPTGLAYIAFFQAVAALGAERAAFSIYLIPAIALVTGAGFAGEALPAAGVAGAVCAIVAVSIAARMSAAAPQRQRTTA